MEGGSVGAARLSWDARNACVLNNASPLSAVSISSKVVLGCVDLNCEPLTINTAYSARTFFRDALGQQCHRKAVVVTKVYGTHDGRG